MKKTNSILYESERLRKKRDLSKIDRIKQQKEKKKKKPKNRHTIRVQFHSYH